MKKEGLGSSWSGVKKADLNFSSKHYFFKYKFLGNSFTLYIETTESNTMRASEAGQFKHVHIPSLHLTPPCDSNFFALLLSVTIQRSYKSSDVVQQQVVHTT